MKVSSITPAQLGRGEGQLGYRALDGSREQRLIDYGLLKGRHYLARAGQMYGVSDKQPVNLLQQLVRTMVPFLAPNAPLADVTPLRADLEFEAQVRKQIHDRDAQRLKLHEIYQDAVTETLLAGVAFTLNGIKSGGETYVSQNRTLDMGQEFCRLLDLDDVILDPMAKTLDNMRFMGHRYPVSKQDAIDAIAEGCYGAVPEDYEDGQLPNPNIATPEEAAAILEACTTIEDYPRRGERVDENDGMWTSSAERLDETILLWDMVCYINGQVWIFTLPAEPGKADVFGNPGKDLDKFLACYRWRGPASGPINRLTFIRVPFNKMPLAVAQMQRDLAEIADLLANKTMRQLLATKTLTIYDGASENMAMAMKSAPQSGYIRGNPKSVQTVQQGGMIADMMPGTQYFADQWQQATGNLAMAAGTGDTGKTATAFEGIMGRIQGFLDFLRTRVEQLATDDLRVRSFYLSNNPAMQRTVQQTIGQGPGAITASVGVANPGAPQQPGQPPPDYTMQGTHEDFDVNVRSFSMAYTNPAISAKQIQDAMQNVLPAIMQLAAMGQIDPRAAITILARKLNEPDFENLVPDPLIQMLQQQESAMLPQMAADPSGMGDNQDYGDVGPSGRRVPGAQREQTRAMRPGPGQGSPRPQTTPQPMRQPSVAA